MHSNILINCTEQKETERQCHLQSAYDNFIKFTLHEPNDGKITFLKINFKDKEYSDETAYMTNINSDEKINKYGTSCSDIVERINKLMQNNSHPYRCSYAIDWYCGKGISGFFKKIQCVYPYVKSVDFVLTKTSLNLISREFINVD